MKIQHVLTQIYILTNSQVYKNKFRMSSWYSNEASEEKMFRWQFTSHFWSLRKRSTYFDRLPTQLGYDNRVPIRHNSILITFSLINMLIILHSNYWEQSSESLCRFDLTIDRNCLSPTPTSGIFGLALIFDIFKKKIASEKMG